MIELKVKDIEWKTGRYGIDYGYINKIRICHIAFTIMKRKDKDKELLRWDLPRMEDSHHLTREKAKKEARKKLEKYIKYLMIEE